jgi:hypothetical protein
VGAQKKSSFQRIFGLKGMGVFEGLNALGLLFWSFP